MPMRRPLTGPSDGSASRHDSFRASRRPSRCSTRGARTTTTPDPTGRAECQPRAGNCALYESPTEPTLGSIAPSLPGPGRRRRLT
jgi:hypothetical protein